MDLRESINDKPVTEVYWYDDEGQEISRDDPVGQYAGAR